jgi:Protein of unknown function (DUF1566)
MKILLFLFTIVFLFSCKKDKPTPPIISTTTVTAISYTTATSGGDVTNEGGATIVSRGVCWNTSIDPTTANSTTIESGGLGSFTSHLTQLIPNTMYYVRAYAVNSASTGYGDLFTFTTSQVEIPVLTTTEITAITQTNAVSGGNITDDKGGSVTARGVCWGKLINPTIANNKTIDGTGTGAFTSSITELTRNTTYYVRAYSSNSVGTAYGNEISFKTATAFIGDSYQGGKVAYILRTGDPGYVEGETHGLIVTPYDQSTSIKWDNSICDQNQGVCWGGDIMTGAIGMAVGTGNANTIAIVSKLGAGNYAAKLCYDLGENGYSDWYLPSKDELNRLYINKAVIGGFSGFAYWSSTEYTGGCAWGQTFSSPGYQIFNLSKSAAYHVRAVRAF